MGVISQSQVSVSINAPPIIKANQCGNIPGRPEDIRSSGGRMD